MTFPARGKRSEGEVFLRAFLGPLSRARQPLLFALLRGTPSEKGGGKTPLSSSLEDKDKGATPIEEKEEGRSAKEKAAGEEIYSSRIQVGC